MSLQSMIAYGARCSWWDDKAKVGTLYAKIGEAQRIESLPCCPCCHKVLFEHTKGDWERMVDKQSINDPGYPAMLEWLRGKCYPNFDVAKQQYKLWQELNS